MFKSIIKVFVEVTSALSSQLLCITLYSFSVNTCQDIRLKFILKLFIELLGTEVDKDEVIHLQSKIMISGGGRF